MTTTVDHVSNQQRQFYWIMSIAFFVDRHDGISIYSIQTIIITLSLSQEFKSQNFLFDDKRLY